MKFKVTLGSTIYTQPFSKTNKKEKLAVGEILEWELTIRDGNTLINVSAPGFPSWYTVELDNHAGLQSKVPSSRLQALLNHEAPRPIEWPQSGVLREKPGSSSRITVKNCNPDGMAMFVKIYKATDAEAVGRTAGLLPHAGCCGIPMVGWVTWQTSFMVWRSVLVWTCWGLPERQKTYRSRREHEPDPKHLDIWIGVGKFGRSWSRWVGIAVRVRQPFITLHYSIICYRNGCISGRCLEKQLLQVVALLCLAM